MSRGNDPLFQDPGGEWCIRSWAAGDIAALTRHADNPRIWLNLRDSFPHPYGAENARAWIELATTQTPMTHFALATREEAIGGVGLRLRDDVFRRSAEIGYWLAEPWWGRGIATAAVRALTDWAFREFDLLRIDAGVFEWNPASMRVLEKAGYRMEGRMRRAIVKAERVGDQLLYALTRPFGPGREGV